MKSPTRLSCGFRYVQLFCPRMIKQLLRSVILVPHLIALEGPSAKLTIAEHNNIPLMTFGVCDAYFQDE